MIVECKYKVCLQLEEKGRTLGGCVDNIKQLMNVNLKIGELDGNCVWTYVCEQGNERRRKVHVGSWNGLWSGDRIPMGEWGSRYVWIVALNV